MKRNGFTLFELMVVVMIIGIIYGLVLGSFDPKKSVKAVTLENLKQTLLPHWQKGVKIELVIYDRCSEAALLRNDEINEEVEIEMNLGIFKDIKVYKSDRFGGKRELTFAPLRVDKKIYKTCFRYTIFPNGSSSSYIVQSGKSYYTFFPFFEKTYLTNKLDDALDVYLQKEYTKIEVRDD